MIYLDNNATTCLDPEVFRSIKPLMENILGNPSSMHRYGQQAKALLLEAQRSCAQFFGVRTDELVFTSGATEALNLLIHSFSQKGHIISSTLEHSSVLESFRFTKAQVTLLQPLAKGAIQAHQVQHAIQENTKLILLSAANNETGVKTDIGKIAALAHYHQIPFVIDGVAFLGKEPFSLVEGISGACFSGHKIHAPLGCGLAIIRKPLKVDPLIVGGPQQRGLRAGTENLPAIVGFAKAIEILGAQNKESYLRIACLRNQLEEGILAAIPDAIVHGQDEERVSNTSNISFPGIEGETLLILLDLAGIAASHGSACASGALEPSRILLNMGVPTHIARSSIRFSLSRFTTEEEIHTAIPLITQTVEKLRNI